MALEDATVFEEPHVFIKKEKVEAISIKLMSGVV